jgi:two-component system response regulator MprA
MTRVLIADDSETILLLLRTRLEMEGYEVSTAADGEQASAALAAGGGEGPDLILLDAMMPHKSGLEVLRELREAGDETPVLIVSAHREEEKQGEAGELGAAGFIGKPIDFDDLLGRIRTLVGP